MNPFYTPSGAPFTQGAGSSSEMRQEFQRISDGFAVFPDIAGGAGQILAVNDAETGFKLTFDVPAGSVKPQKLTIKTRAGVNTLIPTDGPIAAPI